MESSMLCWEDVRPEHRVDRAFLETRGGAKDPAWVERFLALAENPSCHAAVPWMGTGTRGQLLRFHPCKMKPADGERFCVRHGGAKVQRPPDAEADLRRKWSLDRRIRSIQRAIENFEGRQRRLGDLIVEKRVRLNRLLAERDGQMKLPV